MGRGNGIRTLIGLFDRPDWIEHYGDSPDAKHQRMAQMSKRELEILLFNHWSVMHSMLKFNWAPEDRPEDEHKKTRRN